MVVAFAMVFLPLNKNHAADASRGPRPNLARNYKSRPKSQA
jgi:hypothetical protein